MLLEILKYGESRYTNPYKDRYLKLFIRNNMGFFQFQKNISSTHRNNIYQYTYFPISIIIRYLLKLPLRYNCL